MMIHLIDWFGLRPSSLFHTILSTQIWAFLKDTDSIPAFYSSLVICKGTLCEIWLRISYFTRFSEFQEELFYKAMDLDFFT